MEKFYYVKHGLLFIVYERIEANFSSIFTEEDSRWINEDDAKEHCNILNKEHESKSA